MNLDYILSPLAVRDGALKIFEATRTNQGCFELHLDKLPNCIDYVMKTIQENYPNFDIPFHSRFGHFRAGKINRLEWLDSKVRSKTEIDKLEYARILWDLVIPSVLLDAGAGAEWKYSEAQTGKTFSRSEGLGIASLHLFLESKLSNEKSVIRTDSAALKNFNSETLESTFQVTKSNPLIGVDGRVTLLRNLGLALENKKFFKEGRPGNLIDYLLAKKSSQISAPDILRAILDSLGSIWPGRESFQGTNLGDVWRHSKFDLIAFHKLSQWMTYSLIEPLLDAGIHVSGVDLLTGLPEYRNGGLFLDLGVISFKDAGAITKKYNVASDEIIEWRALTVYLLDLVGKEVQTRLHKSSAEFPLAKVLEGGTWWAGRKIAAEKRSGGTPPLNIESDGTVF